ncbi:MAG: glycosyltransferase family 2 protein [Gammaproteobacteria bacterium]|jgi:glycosyltransferase involved in cell wall biosynthesis
MSLPVSAYLITRNEADNLRRLLPQLQDFAEVILVDCGSTDDTLQVAQGFANVKASHRDWTGFSDQKNHALSLCAQPWVLNLDADEALTPELLAAMQALITADDADALQCERVLIRWGKRPRHFSKPDLLIRCFRRGCGHYEAAKVHERIEISGRIRSTDATLLHFENLTFSQRMAKSNQYSQLKAEDKFAKGARCTIWHLLLVFPVSFIACYFGKGFFLDGSEGILTSMNHAYYNFMKYAKLWELHHH